MVNEQLVPLYFNSDAIVAQPQPIYRLQIGGARLYYTFDKEGNPSFYVSVTTLIRDTLPTPFALIKWIASKGVDEAEEEKMERANYGTLMHICIQMLLIDRKFDFDKLPDVVSDYAKKERISIDLALTWCDSLMKDIMAFAQFMLEYNVRPIAIEIMLAHPTDGYAGALDLCCMIDVAQTGYWGEVYKADGKNAKKGDPKESKKTFTFRAIIDFKSGKKGFFEAHEIQLKAYQNLWEAQYPDLKIDRLFNWAPQDWRGKTPTFKLKDQTNARSQRKLPHLVKIAMIEDEGRERTFTVISGILDIDKGIGGNITEVTLFDAVRKAEKKGSTPKITAEGIEI